MLASLTARERPDEPVRATSGWRLRVIQPKESHMSEQERSEERDVFEMGSVSEETKGLQGGRPEGIVSQPS